MKFVCETKQVDSSDRKLIGELLKSDIEMRKLVIYHTSVGLMNQIKEQFASFSNFIENCKDEERIQIQNEIDTMSTSSISMLAMILRNEQNIGFVWYKPKSDFNTLEQRSRNADKKIVIDTCIYPCLMLKGSRSVFEQAVVTTKLTKHK
ncbi:predicted protein [Naegleria gruberi]|uniref:Predicted protein n=1 Tax=Naegleria gruberi TaxID=5762 RepID=D2V8J8_NAEGR|nr:uncharacterized protein NAEGRDRAFT_65183 [Naegleria gruberi]EFC46698.1 predicted protein [Naegleria gruberi]|eukprot:XP_002679442.1 predicted protein [Naegleria gruberi strain NEG-M]